MKTGSTARDRPMVKYPRNVNVTNFVIVKRTFDEDVSVIVPACIT
ncbi:hypothetical protein ABIB30_001855 [Pedobacter sp. UYP1]